MTASAAVDELDPQRIQNALPEGDQERFLEEYRQAAESAARDVAQYRELRWLLHTWHLRALTRAKPEYETSREQARTGAGTFTSLDEIRRQRQAA